MEQVGVKKQHPLLSTGHNVTVWFHFETLIPLTETNLHEAVLPDCCLLVLQTFFADVDDIMKCLDFKS